MSTTPSIASVCTLAFRAARPRPARGLVNGARRAVAARGYADKAANDPSKLPQAPAKDPVGPNMQNAEHVSEEAAKMAKIMGDKGPDIEGQGTPVQEILKEEPATRENAPKVLKNETSTGKRSFSTMARRMQPEITGEHLPGQLDAAMIPTQAQRAAYASRDFPLYTNEKGHKFPLPTGIVPKKKRTMNRSNHKEEYIVDQLTKLMMRHGELGKAQRYMAHILTVLRTHAPPVYPNRPMLAIAPPAHELPLNPVLYMTLAIDAVAPLFRMRSQKGAAGGGASLQIPVAISLRRRRRTAFMWMLEVASKKEHRSSGKNTFPQRVAEEIIAVVEGRSGCWTKRDQLHKLCTANRINVNALEKMRVSGMKTFVS